MAEADIYVPPTDAELDELSQENLQASGDRAMAKNVEIVQKYTQLSQSGKPRRLTMRFLVSPVELIGDEDNGITRMRLVKNELYATDAGTLRPRATDQFEEIPVGLVFRSVGYRGVALPDVPFYDSWGVILNERGRILDPDSREPLVGMYTAGWIKRGPSGVIGTNKPDAVETVGCMLEDLKAGKVFEPEHSAINAAEEFIRQQQPEMFTFDDWLKLDELEITRGQEQGRPRVKFASVDEMLAALGRK
jgi:ferredoxin--NADP+ reductase